MWENDFFLVILNVCVLKNGFKSKTKTRQHDQNLNT